MSGRILLSSSESREYITGWKQGCIETVIDCEGSLSLIRYKRPYKNDYDYQPLLSITNTSEVYLDMINNLTRNLGHINIQKHGDEKNKACFRLTFSGDALRDILPNIGLIIKEQQRLLLLDALDVLDTMKEKRGRCIFALTPKAREILDEIWLEMRKLNKRGDTR